MSTTRLEKVTEEYKDKFPHMKHYAACQSRAFMTGTFSFLAGAAVVYSAQEMLRSRLPFGRQHFLLLPIGVGTASAYIITRRNTRICQDMWLALEEKHSAITPLEERLQQKASGLQVEAATTQDTLPSDARS